MENVSHNTSFDSAEEDNLSRDPDQRVFEEQDTPNLEMALQRERIMQQMQSQQIQAEDQPHQFQQNNSSGNFAAIDPTNFVMARGSLAETEQNDYGFPASAANPTEHMRQVYWEEFQRQQQSQASLHAPPQQRLHDGESDPTAYEPFDPDQAAKGENEDAQSAENQSRPTAAFGHQGAASSTLLNYADEINQIDDDEDAQYQQQHEMMLMESAKPRRAGEYDYLRNHNNSKTPAQSHQLQNLAHHAFEAGFNSNNDQQFYRNDDLEEDFKQMRDGGASKNHQISMVQQSRMMTENQAASRHQSQKQLENNQNQSQQHQQQSSQQQSLVYRDELSRRYYPNEQLKDQLIHSSEQLPQMEAVAAGQWSNELEKADRDYQMQPTNLEQSNQHRQHMKKKSARKADFLNKGGESFTSDHNMMNQSHASSSKHSSILESLRNQASRQAQTPKDHVRSIANSDRGAVRTATENNSNSAASQPHSRTQSNHNDGPSQAAQQYMYHQSQEQREDASPSEQQHNYHHYRQESFPQSSDNAAADESISRGTVELKASKRMRQRAANTSRQFATDKAKVVAMLRIKITMRNREDNLLKKLAFEKFYSNRQNSILDQLLVDNENLMDQVQGLQQHLPTLNTTNTMQAQQEVNNEALNAGGAATTILNENNGTSGGVYQLYNGVGIHPGRKKRNNSKTDQTHHNTFQPARNQILSLVQMNTEKSNNAGQAAAEHNSSNKDLSPGPHFPSKDTAFMRAMLRDDAPIQHSPFQFRPVNNLDEKFLHHSVGGSDLAHTSFFEQFSRQLRDLTRQCERLYEESNDVESSLKNKLSDLSQQFDFEVEKIRGWCIQLNQQKDLLSVKVQGVDRLELDNLELHMQLDAKLRALETLLRCGSDASKLFKFDHKKVAESACQTETVYSELVQKEASLQVQSKELSLIKVRQEEDYSSKVRDLDKRECDLEIRERLIEEKRIEYSFKQKELNQRIKSQMTWPLNCLENDARLLEKFKDFKLKPDHLKSLEADSNLSMFLQREENLELMQGFEGQMLAKCEGLLHFEYLILKERAKNMVFHENTINELASLQAEGEELAKDRERYQVTADLERQLQLESQRVDRQRQELEKIQANLFDIIKLVNEAFQQQQLSVKYATSNAPVSPQPKSPLPSHQLNLLLGNLQKSYSSGPHHSQPLDIHGQSDTNINSGGISPSINPYSQTINAKDPATLLQVVHDYRATDPMLNRLQTKDIQSLIEQTIEHLESSSRVQNAHSSPTADNNLAQSLINSSQHQESQNLRQIRRMLIRDAYFLQKERQWLDQERLKLNSMIAQQANRHKIERRSAQVQTSIEKLKQRTQKDSASHFNSPDQKEQQQVINLHRVNVSQPHVASSLDDSATRHMQHIAASPNDSISIMSTIEQDRKKIQLLQTNLGLEKEYNRDLNTQLAAQMELIKMQNEKLLEGEHQINEMKLRLLIKFEQIKLLEDYYNRQHQDSFEKQIHLDIELDEEQLKQIVIQLYKKHQQEDFPENGAQNQLISVNRYIDDEDDFNDVSASQDEHLTQNQTLDLAAANLTERKHYKEFWALEGVASMLRHLLMDRCKFNPAQHRLQYAFMLFRAATLRESTGFLTGLAGGSQTALHALLGENMVENANNQFDLSHQNSAVNVTDHSIVQIMDDNQRVEQKSDVQEDSRELVQTDSQDRLPIFEHGKEDLRMDWFQIYWTRQRGKYFSEDGSEQPTTFEELKRAAKQLESDIATFWRFRARNTLRLMYLHSARRQRMLQAFAFQRFKVQTMRLTIQRVLQSRVEVQTQVQILNQNQSDEEPQQDQQQSNRLAAGKKHALVMMLTMRNGKFSELREKNRVFNRWRKQVTDAQTFTVQLEMARLAKEVQNIKLREEVLRTDFLVQKTELESKVNMLLGMLAQ